MITFWFKKNVNSSSRFEHKIIVYQTVSSISQSKEQFVPIFCVIHD